MTTSDHEDARDQISGDERSAGSEALADRRSPMQPDPQGSDPHDEPDVSSDGSDPETTNGADEHDTSVDRYRDSPGAAIDDTSGDVPEPNEPG